MNCGEGDNLSSLAGRISVNPNYLSAGGPAVTCSGRGSASFVA